MVPWEIDGIMCVPPDVYLGDYGRTAQSLAELVVLTTRLLHGNTQWLILTSTPAFIPDFSYPHAR